MTIQNQLDRSCMIPQPVTFLFFLSKDLASGSPLNNTQDGYIWSIIQVHADWIVYLFIWFVMHICMIKRHMSYLLPKLT